MQISQYTRSLTNTFAALWVAGLPYALGVARAASDCIEPGTETTHGVLIDGRAKNFPCFVSELLRKNMPYVILIAVVLIVASGVQYMLAQGSSGDQGKAKQRILGVLTGVLFYFLIQYIMPLLVSGAKLLP